MLVAKKKNLRDGCSPYFELLTEPDREITRVIVKLLVRYKVTIRTELVRKERQKILPCH